MASKEQFVFAGTVAQGGVKSRVAPAKIKALCATI
jgi:hypothetical protein